ADPNKPPKEEGQGFSLGAQGRAYFPAWDYQNGGSYFSVTRAATPYPLSYFAPDLGSNAGPTYNPPVLVPDSQGYPNMVMVKQINKGLLDNDPKTFNAFRLTEKETSLPINAMVDTVVIIAASEGDPAA